MKTILLYTENYLNGGGNRYLGDMVNAIPDTYDVLLASNPGGIADADLGRITRKFRYEMIDVRVSARLGRKFPHLPKRLRKAIYVLFLPWYQRKNYRLFSALIHRAQPALVIAHNGGYPGGLSALDLIRTCKKLGIKCVLSAVSVPRKASIADYLYRDIPHLVTKLLTNSHVIKKALIATRGFREEDFVVIFNGIGSGNGTGAWNFQKKSGERLLAYTGRIERDKGSYVLMDAFKEVSAGQNVRLLMVGAGPELGAVKEYAASIGLGDKVIFTGHVTSGIPAMLAMADIFVFPSLWEGGSAYSLLEAMKAGKIIVATTVGGNPEAIVNGQEGILVPPGNTEALAEALRDVIMKFDKYSYLGTNAKKRVDQEFTLEIFRKNIVTLLASTI